MLPYWQFAPCRGLARVHSQVTLRYGLPGMCPCAVSSQINDTPVAGELLGAWQRLVGRAGPFQLSLFERSSAGHEVVMECKHVRIGKETCFPRSQTNNADIQAGSRLHVWQVSRSQGPQGLQAYHLSGAVICWVHITCQTPSLACPTTVAKLTSVAKRTSINNSHQSWDPYLLPDPPQLPEPVERLQIDGGADLSW